MQSSKTCVIELSFNFSSYFLYRIFDPWFLCVEITIFHSGIPFDILGRIIGRTTCAIGG